MSQKDILYKLIDKLSESGFTGKTTIDWKDGIPMIIEEFKRSKITEALVSKA